MRKTCLLLLLTALPAVRGGVTSCATSANGNALSSFGLTSASNGCTSVDATYTSLALSGASKSGNGAAPMTGTLDMYSSGGNLFVDGLAPISGSGTESATFGFEATANPNLAFASLTLGAAAQYLSNGSSVTITEHLCLNATQATAGGNCSAAELGTLTEQLTAAGASYTCSFGSAGVCLNGNSDEVTFTNMLHGPTMIAVSESVTVSSNAWVQLSYTDNNFGVEMEAPEPSALALTGAALAGIGAILRKQRSTAGY